MYDKMKQVAASVILQAEYDIEKYQIAVKRKKFNKNRPGLFTDCIDAIKFLTRAKGYEIIHDHWFTMSGLDEEQLLKIYRNRYKLEDICPHY